MSVRGQRGVALRFRLLDLPGSLLHPVSSPTVAEVNAWWVDRVQLHLPPGALPLLDAWSADNEDAKGSASTSWSHTSGPGRSPEEVEDLIAFLRQKVEAGEPFTFNALWREKQGGRSYPFFLGGYDGPLTISGNAYEAAGKAGPRHLLAAIRRDVRGVLTPPKGWTLMVGDFVACHPHLGLALSGDEQLARDLEGDFHQAIGNKAASRHDRATRRRVGKLINNRMLFGITPRGLQRDLHEEFGVALPLDRVGLAWTAWWARYPALAGLRDEVISLVSLAQREDRGLEIVSPSGWTSWFSAAEVRGLVSKHRGKRAPGPDAFWRTVFSALFRAVEGDLLDRTIALFVAGHDHHGGQLVMPIYDGLFVGAPVGREATVAQALAQAGAKAAAELGVVGMRMVVKP